MTSSESTSFLLQPFPNFYTATSTVLKFLQSYLGFDLCMVTHVKGQQWVVLDVEDRHYGIESGRVLPWSESLCCQILAERSTSVVPDISAIAQYADNPFCQKFNIGAYISLPLRHSNGELFGTLCAFHPTTKPASIAAQRPLLNVIVQLLVSLLESDLKLMEQKRKGERSQLSSWQDPLTGLYNRDAWLHFLNVEDGRCKRYGREASIITLEFELTLINQAEGKAKVDQWIKQMSQLLKDVLREQDIIARVSGNEIAIIALETEAERLGGLIERLQVLIGESHFNVALGCAIHTPGAELSDSWHRAQTSMHMWKRHNPTTLSA